MSAFSPVWTRIGLRGRLVLLVATALGPLTGYQIYELFQERERRISVAIERVQENARVGAGIYREAVDDARSTLELLSHVPEVVRGAPEACQRFLTVVQQGRPWSEALFRVDVTGRITCSTVPTAVGLDVSKREWYLKTLAAKRFTVSDFYITLSRKRPTVAAVLPLEAEVPGGAPQILMANFDLAWFDRLAESISKKNDATVLLVDGAGRGVSRYPAMPEIVGKDLSGVDAVWASLANEAGLFQGKGISGKERFFGYMRLPDTDARLMVSLDRTAVLAPIDFLILKSALLFLAIVAMLGFAIWLTGKRIFVEPLLEAGQALRKSETFLRGVVEGSGDCIKVVDLEGRLEFISRNGQCLMEIDDPATVLGQPFLGLWPEAMHLDVSMKLDDARIGETVRFDAEILTAKGNPLHVDVLITPILDAEGQPERLVAIARDITELKLAERHAREAEILFRGLFDHATDSLTVHQVLPDGSFQIETWNPYAATLMGRTAEAVRGLQVEDVLPPEAAASIRADLEQVTREKQALRREGVQILEDGSHQVWEIIHVPLLDEASGRVVRIFGSGRDITHLRKIETAVRESEARYRLLADYSSDLIVLGHADGRRSYISPAVTAMLGYTVAEAQAISMREWIHPDDLSHVFAITSSLSVERPMGSVIYRLKRKDGAYIWAEAAFRYLETSEGGVQIITAIRDVSDRQRTAQELRLAKEAAEVAKTHADAANAAKTDFLATMSHEIRTPLNAIIGFTGLIIDRSAELAPEVRRHAELVQSSGSALLTVVNDILDFSKVEAGAVELELRPFAVASLVDNCVSITRGEVKHKEVEIKISLDPGLPRTLVGDADRLRQILLNLLNNAIKFTQYGYVAVNVRHEASSGQGERLRFTITDTGIGIPKEKQARLFSRFSQADSSIKRDFGGTGLGLAICKSLVELMNGEIGVFSDDGQGATFWFTVILPRGHLEPVPVATQRGEANRKIGRLLLVEDVEMNQELARAVLEAHGHSVDVVSDGAAAVLAVQDHDYDLVLMDVQMPGMDGLSATQIIRRMAKPGTRLPIIAMTANVLPAQVRSFREAGMDDHVGKPFQRAELYATIDRWLPDPGTSSNREGVPSAELLALRSGAA